MGKELRGIKGKDALKAFLRAGGKERREREIILI
jgi:hypothetical protein